MVLHLFSSLYFGTESCPSTNYRNGLSFETACLELYDRINLKRCEKIYKVASSYHISMISQICKRGGTVCVYFDNACKG